jgi:hypothetical protein
MSWNTSNVTLDSAKSNTQPYVRLGFGVFLIFYVIFIIYKPNFGLVDDINMVTSYLAGRHLPLFIQPLSGRFYPFPGQEYNLIAFLVPSPISFYVVNALELLIAGWLLASLGKLAISGLNSYLPYVFAALVMLNPGFAEAWLRLLVTERSEFIFLGLFLLYFIKLHTSQKNMYWVPCIIAASAALLCKETVFILVGGIGFFHLCLDREGTVKSRSLDAGLMVLSCIWLTVYYELVYRHRGPNLYSAKSSRPLDAFLHTLTSNALHDPWLILCLFVLLAARLNRVIRTREVEPLLDSVLLSCFFFYLAYLVLRMSNIYYLLPLYVFVPYVACRVMFITPLKKIFRPALLVILCALFATQFLSGIREVITWKFAPANFQSVLSFITHQIPNSPKRLNIFLAGSSRGSGIELYNNLGEYLVYTGLRPEQFDIKSDIPIDEPIPYFNTLQGTPNCPYSYCRPEENDQPSPGDYILLTPYDSEYKRSVFSDQSRYRLVYRNDTPVAPDPSIKALAGHILPHGLKKTGNGEIDANYYLYRVL